MQYKCSQNWPIIIWCEFLSRERAEVFQFNSEILTCEFGVNVNKSFNKWDDRCSEYWYLTKRFLFLLQVHCRIMKDNLRVERTDHKYFYVLLGDFLSHSWSSLK
jgi:hypothetical protein